MNKIIVVLVIFCFLTGCSSLEEEKDILEYKNQIDELHIIMDKLETDNKNYQKELEVYKGEVRSLQVYNGLLEAQLQHTNQYTTNKISSDNEEFLWIGDIKKFDKIIISIPNKSNRTYVITDENILKISLDTIAGTITKGYEPPNPTESQEVIYSFYKNDKIYTVSVIDYNLFEYNGSYYNSTNNLYYLSDSFLSEPEYVKEDKIFRLINESYLLVGEKEITYPILGNDRNKLIISCIYRMIENNEINILYNKPNTMGDMIERLTFFNHGEKVVMDIYDKYISITYGEQIRLYKAGENISISLNILSNLYAD